MGRGYVVGLLAGALFSSVSVSALSLMMPPVAPPAPTTPDTAKAVPITPAPVPAEAPPAEVASAETPAAEPAPAPQPEPAPEPVDPAPAAAPAPEAPATESETASVTPRPETPVVEVPAGSEFNRAKPEEAPVLPAPQPAPAAGAAPVVEVPAADDAGPAMTERMPAAAPESQASAPAAIAEPAPQPEAIAEAPAGETAVPVPPPGEAVLPDLVPAAPETETAAAAPAPLPEAEAAPTPAPEATEESVPEPEPEVASPLPQIITPAPEAEQAIVPAPAPESPAALKPRIITPGNGNATGNGPVIIDVAPQAPIGAAAGPAVGFNQKVPGVQVNRLPRIGVVEPAPEPAAEVADVAPDTAVARYGASFANPEGKPIIAIVLTDDGTGAAADAEEVAAIGAPVTIALDPEQPGVAVLAQTYRLSGDEIAILAPAMPTGATPSDIEVSYQGFVQTLPEAVALVAGPGSALQSDRRIAQHLASLLATEGRGLVTQVRGLNPGRQAAERAGVAYAGIGRLLDEEGQDGAAMTRLLDRAAFDASRGGNIVILGKASPETVAALRGWIEAGQKDAIIGPLSAVLAP
ncbi:MAG TPA: divergent polysaccharide deacetylase family protein [Albidovulum sp.]|uniref:divergent polysaccharide deacetylase family protein n=1 Tax=Albidovulum sp. TaxID=1872424 RepID=UPI002C932703|nr:divergent polysaccharide deacetylase family protein [Albidovulum sp.]